MSKKTSTPKLENLERRYRALAAQLAGIGIISAGSLTRRFTHWNRPGCKCGGDPPELHGPYFQWTAKIKGRTVTRRLSAEEARRYAEWIANDRELRRILAEMRKVAEQAALIRVIVKSCGREISLRRRRTRLRCRCRMLRPSSCRSSLVACRQ